MCRKKDCGGDHLGDQSGKENIAGGVELLAAKEDCVGVELLAAKRGIDGAKLLAATLLVSIALGTNTQQNSQNPPPPDSQVLR